MVQQNKWAIVLGIVSVWISGCLGAGHSGDRFLSANFQILDQAKVDNFMNWNQSNCWSCHANGATSGGVGGYQSIGFMIYSGELIPGNAEASPFFQAAAGDMPPSIGPLVADIENLRDWINTGMAPAAPE